MTSEGVMVSISGNPPRTQLAPFEHTTLILGVIMPSEFDVAFLDPFSNRLLNDFRDEVPIYSHNKHKI